MKKYISSTSRIHSEISIACTYYRENVKNPTGNGAYWNEKLLSGTIAQILGNFGFTINSINMFEVPDLLEDDPEWFEEGAPDGMAINVICNELISDEETKEEITSDIENALSHIDYEVVDVEFGTV